ncbi:MAG: peptidase M4 [Candidatus Binatia bacterium]
MAVNHDGEGSAFTIGPGVARAVHGQPYERRSDEPLLRPLKIFTLDPAISQLDGAVAVVNVPYEPLDPGPVGRVFEVDNSDGQHHISYRRVHLDDPNVSLAHGREPSPSDPQFHQQMVYAVSSLVYAAFRSALGRHIAWGFNLNGTDKLAVRLRLRPHANNERNAYYDKECGEICFGYFRADAQAVGRNLPGGFVFTCLSHDIIAHEVTHALLDGLRTQLDFPSGPDALAFHEAFADLVAIFQHFSYEQVLRTAIRRSGGRLEESDLLTALAGQFGHTTGSGRPLRSAVDITDDVLGRSLYEKESEPHARGSILVSSVFEAFTTIFKRKVERYIRLATNGSGVLPAGELSPDLREILADEASKLARQFLTICIRAIDYCPPIDLEFGEFLRAVITADADLVPHDEWGYREAWVDAFRRRRIYPQGVFNLSEHALRWQPPEQYMPEIPELSFAQLQFDGDPGRPAGVAELRRQACALGRQITRPENLEAFGLAHPGHPRLGGDQVDLPCLQSIRSSRRIGPDGQVLFDLVAEVTQRRVVRDRKSGEEFEYYGGATLILGPKGEIRYGIVKNVLNEERLNRQRDFMQRAGRRFWREENGKKTPVAQLFRLVHS